MSITRKFLVELWREPLNLLLILSFPVLLMGFYYLAFGGADQSLASALHILVYNEDEGDAGALLVKLMADAEFEGQPIFTVEPVVDQAVAETAVFERKAALLLYIPAMFSQALQSSTAQVPQVSLELIGDPNSTNFVFAQSFLEDLVRRFVSKAAGTETAVIIQYEFLPGTGKLSDFDFGVGGIIVFGLVLLVVTTAQPLVWEYVNGTLHRLQLTRVTSSQLLLGLAFAQLIVAAVQILFSFGAAVLMGFEGHGSLLLAVAVGLLFSLSVIGLGLLTAAFVHSDGEAANLGASLGVLMVLISGALFPMPQLTLFVINGRSIQLYDILPAAHAAEALRRVLIFGDGPGAIAYELGMLVILAVCLLTVGIVAYDRRRLRVVR